MYCFSSVFEYCNTTKQRASFLQIYCIYIFLLQRVYHSVNLITFLHPVWMTHASHMTYSYNNIK